jgi:hypothetical protein
MKKIHPTGTASAVILSALSMAASADKGFYREDFSDPVPGFEAYSMQGYDGNNKDSVWGVDTYGHTGPFAFSQGAGGLAITTAGYWEWDYCMLVLPAPVLVQPGDSLVMEARVAAGSGHDSAMVGLQLGNSENQSQGGILFPSPQPVLVKGEWARIGIAHDFGDDVVTHLFINIDAGYTTGPASGWFVEPNKPFSGTLEIRNLSLDGSDPATGTAKAVAPALNPVRIDRASIRYTGRNPDNTITIHDMAGRFAGSSRNAFEFQGNLKGGLYCYRVREGAKETARGTFSLLR